MNNIALTSSTPHQSTSDFFSQQMSSQDIAAVIEKRHDNVMRDIRELISNNVIDSLNFEEISLPDSYGRMQPAYLLDHDSILTLITGYDQHRRKAVVTRWRELEQGLATPMASMQEFTVPQTMVEALRLAADQAEKIESLKVKQLEDAPKVAYVDEVVEQGDNHVTLSDLGRILKKKGMHTGARLIFTQLRQLRIIMSARTIPYNRYVEQGYFVIGQKNTGDRTFPVTFVTGKGQLWIHGKMKEAFEQAENG